MKMDEFSLSNQVSDSLSLDERIANALAEAHAIAEQYDLNSSESAVAWDVVEELQAEAAHQRVARKSMFMAYCEQFPDAAEARLYDV